MFEIKAENQRLRALNMALQEQLLHYMTKPGNQNYQSLSYYTVNTWTFLLDITKKKLVISRSTFHGHAGSVHGLLWWDIVGGTGLFLLDCRC